jgi:hypothetical protein
VFLSISQYCKLTQVNNDLSMCARPLESGASTAKLTLSSSSSSDSEDAASTASSSTTTSSISAATVLPMFILLSSAAVTRATWSADVKQEFKAAAEVSTSY